MKMKPDNSAERKLYLKRKHTRKVTVAALQWLLIFTFLVCWELGVQSGKIDGFMFSSPFRIKSGEAELP